MNHLYNFLLVLKLLINDNFCKILNMWVRNWGYMPQTRLAISSIVSESHHFVKSV